MRWESVRRASLLLFESPSNSSALSGLAPELIQDKGLQELRWGRRIKRNHKKLHCDSPIHFLPLHPCSGLRASSCREMAQKQWRREGLKGFGANREPLCPELFFFLVKAVNILGRTWKALCRLWCHRWRGREALESWAERTKRVSLDGKRPSVHRECPGATALLLSQSLHWIRIRCVLMVPSRRGGRAPNSLTWLGRTSKYLLLWKHSYTKYWGPIEYHGGDELWLYQAIAAIFDIITKGKYFLTFKQQIHKYMEYLLDVKRCPNLWTCMYYCIRSFWEHSEGGRPTRRRVSALRFRG